MKKKLITSTLVAGALGFASSANAAVTMYAEYHLGEAGSLGANNRPQDSSGNNLNFASQINGSNASVSTVGVSAPGSTSYMDTSGTGTEGWYSNNLFTGLATDDFAFGVYTRAASNVTATQGVVFSLGGGADAFSIALRSDGWAAFSQNTATIGGDNGVAGSFTSNAWVHLAVIRAAGITTFYIDGVAQAGTITDAPDHNAAHISVNPGGGGADNYFDGNIDEARIVTFDTGESTQNVLNALQAVPEPSSAAFIGLGGLALILRRRK